MTIDDYHPIESYSIAYDKLPGPTVEGYNYVEVPLLAIYSETIKKCLTECLSLNKQYCIVNANNGDWTKCWMVDVVDTWF